MESLVGRSNVFVVSEGGRRLWFSSDTKAETVKFVDAINRVVEGMVERR
jgi:hypothetical protein